jgi:hypothetical protein
VCYFKAGTHCFELKLIDPRKAVGGLGAVGDIISTRLVGELACEVQLFGCSLGAPLGFGEEQLVARHGRLEVIKGPGRSLHTVPRVEGIVETGTRGGQAEFFQAGVRGGEFSARSFGGVKLVGEGTASGAACFQGIECGRPLRKTIPAVR